jgi:hypothetical protein
MRRLSTDLSRPARAWRRGIVLATALVLTAVMATVSSAAGPSATATGPGGYGVAPTTGTFARLTTNQLVPSGGGFNQMYYLSTSGTTGRTRLPFPIKVYNATFQRIAISSNGNIQLGLASPAGYPGIRMDSECIPTARDFAATTIFVLWSFGLRYNTAGGEGIFLRTQGTAPNRTFTISFQGQFQVSADAPANAQVTFRENSQKITFTYGTLTPQTLVAIGIQHRTRAAYTQWFCNGSGVYPTQGTQLSLGHVNP